VDGSKDAGGSREDDDDAYGISLFSSLSITPPSIRNCYVVLTKSLYMMWGIIACYRGRSDLGAAIGCIEELGFRAFSGIRIDSGVNQVILMHYGLNGGKMSIHWQSKIC
jgi:hypothetical protein